MGIGGYTTPLTSRYVGSDVSLRSGFNCHNIKMDLREGMGWYELDLSGSG
jgi:hypothetical protein